MGPPLVDFACVRLADTGLRRRLLVRVAAAFAALLLLARDGPAGPLPKDPAADFEYLLGVPDIGAAVSRVLVAAAEQALAN